MEKIIDRKKQSNSKKSPEVEFTETKNIQDPRNNMSTHTF